MRNLIVLTGIALLGLVAAACGQATAPPNGGAAAQPAAARPAPTILTPPLHDAQAGEWATYVRGHGDGENLLQIRVVAGGDETVKVETTRYLGAVPQGRPTTAQWHRNGFGMPPGGVIRSIDRDHLDVEGKFVACWRLRVHSRHDVRYYWISEEFPVHGVIQIDRVVKGQPEGHPFRLREYAFGEE